MKIKYGVLFSALIAVGYSLSTYANILEQSQDAIKTEFHKPHKIIEIFYEAVKRGELIVFEQKLNKSMITPIRVEYVYELNGAVPTVKIYSEIKKLISIPLHEGIKFRGVSTILDSSGNIIEIRAHVVPE